MRICFIAVTISVYIALIVYAITWCFARNSVEARRQRQTRRDMELGYPPLTAGAMAAGDPWAKEMPPSMTPQPMNMMQTQPQAMAQSALTAGGDVATTAAPPSTRANDVGYRYSSSTSRPTASYTRQHTIQSHYHKARMTEDADAGNVKVDRREQSPVPTSFPERLIEPVSQQANASRNRRGLQGGHNSNSDSLLKDTDSFEKPTDVQRI